jgi:hypothetical protein
MALGGSRDARASVGASRTSVATGCCRRLGVRRLAQGLRQRGRRRIAVDRILGQRLAQDGLEARREGAACGPSSGGGSCRCFRIVEIGVSPRKGTSPVNIS